MNTTQTRSIILGNATAFGLTDKCEIAIQLGSLADALALAAAEAQRTAVDSCDDAPDSDRRTVLAFRSVL